MGDPLRLPASPGTPRILPLAAALALAVVAFLPGRSSAKKQRDAIYDAKADATAQIAAAVAKAKRDNKRVLVMFGGNWCGWCHKLHDVFKKERAISRLLLYDYELVLVDIGQFDKHTKLAKGYGADLKKHGVPFLTVLGSDGKALANQNTGDLEDGPRHDPGKVKAFLEKWAAKPLDAEKVLKDALSRAEAEKKRVLVHLGAPW